MATVFVNDIFKSHINPAAKDKTLLLASRVSLFVIAATLLSVVLFFRHIGFSFAGMYQAMGIAFSSAVIPVIMACFVRTTNRNGAFWAAILGSVCGMTYWTATGADLLWGVVWGNIIVLSVSALIAVPWTLLRPQPFDYSQPQGRRGRHPGVATPPKTGADMSRACVLRQPHHHRRMARPGGRLRLLRRHRGHGHRRQRQEEVEGRQQHRRLTPQAKAAMPSPLAFLERAGVRAQLLSPLPLG